MDFKVKDPSYKIRDEDGKWLDSSVFRQEAIRFEKYGYYTPEVWGSPGWQEYWQRQLEYCEHGFSVGGERITGHHYFYLNFTKIMVIQQIEGTEATEKIEQFPDFWDGDYDFFWSLDIARWGVKLPGVDLKATPPEEVKRLRLIELERLKLKVKPHPDYLMGGFHFIVGKSRRKGYSFKNGAICVNIYNTKRNAQVVIGASDKKFLYPEGTMGMASNYMDFLNENTGWRKSRDYINKIDHKKASFVKNVEGTSIESGYKSQVFALTFKDNPDAARGKSPVFTLLEEAGAFPNLKASYSAIKPGLGGGKFITGQIVIFGTGGDMESGTVDFADMFYNPIGFGLMPFINIWDDDAGETVCGFFHPLYMNLEGFYDEQGNSDIEAAIKWEMERREVIRHNSTDSSTIQRHVQEFCLKPSEAFLTVSTNDFPIIELRNQLNKVIRENLMLTKGTPVDLFRNSVTGKVEARPDLSGNLQPVQHYKIKDGNYAGCPMIYEFPQANTPKGLFKIGFDPYRQDQSSGNSLAAIYVYKTVQKGSYTKNIIAASYVGRLKTTDDVNRVAELFAELYNAEIMYENEVPDVKAYFERRRKLHLLAAQPDRVISKNVKNSTVARIYGCHMNDKLKDAGAKYLKRWLTDIRDYDENGEALTNIDYIYDIGLLEELIQYNLKGNFDRVMAMMQVMFQIEEDELDKEHNPSGEISSNAKDLLGMMDKLYKK